MRQAFVHCEQSHDDPIVCFLQFRISYLRNANIHFLLCTLCIKCTKL